MACHKLWSILFPQTHQMPDLVYLNIAIYFTNCRYQDIVFSLSLSSSHSLSLSLTFSTSLPPIFFLHTDVLIFFLMLTSWLTSEIFERKIIKRYDAILEVEI